MRWHFWRREPEGGIQLVKLYDEYSDEKVASAILLLRGAAVRRRNHEAHLLTEVLASTFDTRLETLYPRPRDSGKPLAPPTDPSWKSP